MSKERRLTPGKGYLDGLGQNRPFEILMLRQKPEVIKVLHSGVGDVQRDHGLKFFGNGAFRRVAKKPWRFKIQEGWIRQFLRPWNNHVPKTNINLQR